MGQALQSYAQSRAQHGWELVPSGAGGGFLRIGARTVRLPDIASFAVRHVWDPNIEAHLAAVALLMGLGSLLILPVQMQLLEPRYVVGGALFVAIGFAVLAETRKSSRFTVYGVDITLRSGERVRFSTPDIRESAALAASLGHALGRT